MRAYLWAAWIASLAAQGCACWFMRAGPWRTYLRLDLFVSLVTFGLALLPISWLCRGWQWSETPLIIGMCVAGVAILPDGIRGAMGTFVVLSTALCCAIWVHPECDPRELYVGMLLVARVTIEASVIAALIIAAELRYRISREALMVAGWMGTNMVCYLARLHTSDRETAAWLNVAALVASGIWYLCFAFGRVVTPRFATPARLMRR